MQTMKNINPHTNRLKQKANQMSKIMKNKKLNYTEIGVDLRV